MECRVRGIISMKKAVFAAIQNKNGKMELLRGVDIINLKNRKSR
jgi:hypothetical protein